MCVRAHARVCVYCVCMRAHAHVCVCVCVCVSITECLQQSMFIYSSSQLLIKNVIKCNRMSFSMAIISQKRLPSQLQAYSV